MNEYRIVEIQNAWGEYDKHDRPAFQIWFGEQLWTTLCYRTMAERCAKLEQDRRNRSARMDA